MRTMRDKPWRALIAAALCIALVATMVWVAHKPPAPAGSTAAAPIALKPHAAHSSPRDVINSGSADEEKAAPHDIVSPLRHASRAAPSSTTDIDKLGSGRELVEFARRTGDSSLQLYSLWGASHVCKAYALLAQDRKRFSAFGAANPERTERTLRLLMDESQDAASGLRDRCIESAANDELLQQLIAESSRSRLPLFSAQDALAEMQRDRDRADAAVAKARAQLGHLIAGDRPATMILLISSAFGGALRDRLSPEFPATAADDWKLGPITAAYQIAACRSREFDCGAGSLARDAVCARYGECRAIDVESSYRRLFDLYEIPFADTDRFARKLQRAIAARDTVTLLP